MNRDESVRGAGGHGAGDGGGGARSFSAIMGEIDGLVLELAEKYTGHYSAAPAKVARAALEAHRSGYKVATCDVRLLITWGRLHAIQEETAAIGEGGRRG